jgi:hypothetical protein
VSGPRRLKWPVKLALALAVAGAFGFLFMRSVRTSRAEPYTVSAESLRGWRVELEVPSGPGSPVLVLRPPAKLAAGLFQQIFSRNMESLTSPANGGIPLLLGAEFERSFAGRVTPEALLAAAQAAVLDGTTVAPRCLGYRRVSDINMPHQLYFVLFEDAAVDRFRRHLRTLAGSDFDPAAQSPVLIVAATDGHFERWLPLRADAKVDCVAPIAVAGDP